MNMVRPFFLEERVRRAVYGPAQSQQSSVRSAVGATIAGRKAQTEGDTVAVAEMKAKSPTT
jgi:hypothetical protein